MAIFHPVNFTPDEVSRPKNTHVPLLMEKLSTVDKFFMGLPGRRKLKDRSKSGGQGGNAFYLLKSGIGGRHVYAIFLTQISDRCEDARR